MLPKSRKPQIIRLHSLQQYERDRFISNYLSTLTDLFPSVFKSKLFSNPYLKNLLPDIYFTFITICVCRKRLGEQYTYVAMHNDKHYEQEGVLVNKKYRTLVFVLQIIGRNFVTHFLESIETRLITKVKNPQIKALMKCIGSTSQILSNVQWFLMILFMLNITKSPSLIDVKLGLNYIYTFFNEKQTKISYKFQGLLLLAVFIIKLVNFFFNLRKQLILQQQKQSIDKENQLLSNKKAQSNDQQDKQVSELCRICYDRINQKSCTKCGHTFCWECIIKSLQINNQCPVCRTKCLPREVIQLVNY